MIQVGSNVGFHAYPAPTGSTIYSYVWGWWDGTSTATSAPFTAKVVNIGGHPLTDQLHYSCTPVAVDGQFTTTYLGSGVNTLIGNVSGTWAGNGTVYAAAFKGTNNTLNLTVTSPLAIACYVSDSRGGTTAVDFSLRGYPAPPPAVGLTLGVPGISTDASTPPTARIGAGQNLNFTVYVAPLPNQAVSFLWNFSGSYGWTMPPSFTSGTTTVLPTGAYQNSVVRDISAEIVSSGTSKAVTAEVQVTAVNTLSGQISRSKVDYGVTLVANSAPSSVAITRLNGAVPISGTGPVSAGTQILFTAVGSDPNSDILFYKWQFTQPFSPNPVYYWGPKVLYDTSLYTSGQSVQGQLTVYDWLGASLTTVLPVTTIM